MTQIKSLVDAIDSFIKGTKADGDWDAIKASCIMAGWDGLAGCLTPLKGTAPTNNGPFVSGDYNRITGMKGNKSTKFLNSNRNNNADPQNDQHVSVFVGEVGSTDFGPGIGYAMIGAGISQTGVTGIHRESDGLRFAYRNRSSGSNHVTVTPARGFLGQTRSASGAFSARAIGEADSFSVASQTPFNGNVLVFARGTEASPSVPTDYRLSFYSIGESLNLANLDTRVSALMTAIGEALA